ncbi:MAG: hypothetical protein Q7R58_02375 [bacterium]|nr:hypothetical protein [bacterium]
MEKIAGRRLTMTETRHLTSILARVHKKARVPTKEAVKEAVQNELRSIAGEKGYWKRRLTKMAYAALDLDTAKKARVSRSSWMGAINHQKNLVKWIPEHDR